MSNDTNTVPIGRYRLDINLSAGQKVPRGNDLAFSDAMRTATTAMAKPSPLATPVDENILHNDPDIFTVKSSGNLSLPKVLHEEAKPKEKGTLSSSGTSWGFLRSDEVEKGPLQEVSSVARRDAIHAYRDGRLRPGQGPDESGRPPGSPESLLEQIRKYKEDQLLANPGGDHYFLDRTSQVIDRNYDHTKLENRVGKDLKDAFHNFLNIFRDLALGSTHRYLDRSGEVRESKDRGILSHLGGFIREVGQALKPEGGFRLTGIPTQVGSFFKRILFDAIGKELIAGVSHSAINVAKDVALTGLNLAEVVPDATLGNVEIGRKITTELFDDAQVIVNYGTDVLPTKDGWERVFAPGSSEDGKKVPLLYNLKTPEQELQDPRWQEVRNTPFRKAIETVGAIASKLWFFSFFSKGIWAGSRKRE